jgi:acetyl-CoA carboxylase carboxyltransferase component
MVWEPEIEELRKRRMLAARLGGEERVGRHRAAGKLTVRERIDALIDEGTFREVGSTAGFATYGDDGELTDFMPANFVFGRAEIDGRPIVVAGDDFTVRGGSSDAAIWRKAIYAEQLARELRVPMVRLVDGSSGGGSVKSYHDIGRTYVPPLPGWADQAAMLSEVPVIAAALGSVAGLGAARVAASHFSVMVEGTSQIFTAGPPVVAYATREDVDKEELGGVQVHGVNGTVDNVARSEEEAFAHIHAFLSYLPRNVTQRPPRANPTDDSARRDDGLLSIIPRNRRESYDPIDLIQMIVDRESLFMIGSGWGQSVITGLARLDGYPVGILGADPNYLGGTLTAGGAQKMRRFVDLCDTFHLPLVNLVDQPGFAVGIQAEVEATIRHGVTAIAALYQLSVPVFTVIVRRAFGVAGAALVDRGEPDVRVAWPSGDWGSLPLEGGVEAAYRRVLAESDDPEALREELLAGFEAIRSPFRTADAFDIEEIIDPRDTRPMLCDWVNLVWDNITPAPRTHGYRP